MIFMITVLVTLLPLTLICCCIAAGRADEMATQLKKLSWEELAEMDGQPVYAVQREAGFTAEAWMLVRSVQGKGIYLVNKFGTYHVYDEVTISVYRYPPRREENQNELRHPAC